MKHWKLTQWCHHATLEIRYPPDRKAVFEELLQHVDDRSDTFRAEGYTQDETIEQTLAAMGDPHELAPLLAAIHRPFWGYTYNVCKWVFWILAAVVLLIAQVCLIQGVSQYENPSDYWTAFESAPFENAIPTYFTPNIRLNDSGYTYTLTEAVVWETADISNTSLYFRLRVQGLPLLSEPRAVYHIWMEDDLGNRYYYDDGIGNINEDEIICYPYHTGPLTWLYEFGTYDFTTQGARWVDIHYDRDGRDMVWRIDLTGGAAE